MARPWQDNVEKFDVVAQFKNHNIGLIINLQEAQAALSTAGQPPSRVAPGWLALAGSFDAIERWPPQGVRGAAVGEHAECGPGNLPCCGFTYNPELFMVARIGFVNLSWRDMGVPTLDKMMDIVMQHCTAVEGRRVAIHCHAGLGRTGLAAACFLVFTREAPSAAAAVTAVRAARPGALQTPAQVLFVSIFEQYLSHLRCAFRAADPSKLFLGRESFFVARTSQALRRTQSSRGSSGGGGGGGGSFGRGSDAAAAAEAALLAAADPVSAAAALGPVAISPVAPADAGASSDPGGPAPPQQQQQQQQHPAPGFVMHARRLSGGGGSMKLLCNPLDAIKEDDRPMHIITTEMAVTEVYGDGLTIIRAAPGCRDAAERPLKLEQALAAPGEKELGLDARLPWTEKFQH
ncbi:protein tyrosine phosphatase domain containing 1 [Monoraphidium neglectum]|uniref:Protein tyrosine phosphatase domain containing 1 n=1 Tax=Monoraphidium neglectum TaxID=145388 RepID=A0A0D2MFG9_9CHLO|nr:protein tyrosine phosphatase domain containing 1 [Monoraphidium neglectum]KIY93850.1 protein tyrosine phosphatase domain containing 1 [Monoraphidium neglectum]|eukprot:XP_013892870.1 protein tyrosine phosphatase domain containing 1 [Monoraphidium neglectum]